MSVIKSVNRIVMMMMSLRIIFDLRSERVFWRSYSNIIVSPRSSMSIRRSLNWNLVKQIIKHLISFPVGLVFGWRDNDDDVKCLVHIFRVRGVVCVDLYSLMFPKDSTLNHHPQKCISRRIACVCMGVCVCQRIPEYRFCAVAMFFNPWQ